MHGHEYILIHRVLYYIADSEWKWLPYCLINGEIKHDFPHPLFIPILPQVSY